MQVVQRVQRYGRNCLLRRSLLSLMVSELMCEDDSEPQQDGSKEIAASRNAPSRGYEYDDKGRPLMDSPNARAMMSVLKRLNVRGKTEVSRADLAKVPPSSMLPLPASELYSVGGSYSRIGLTQGACMGSCLLIGLANSRQVVGN